MNETSTRSAYSSLTSAPVLGAAAGPALSVCSSLLLDSHLNQKMGRFRCRISERSYCCSPGFSTTDSTLVLCDQSHRTSTGLHGNFDLMATEGTTGHVTPWDAKRLLAIYCTVHPQIKHFRRNSCKTKTIFFLTSYTLISCHFYIF